MKIINLVENTEGSSHCGAEHGLSYYIETKKHRILMDTGASDLFMKNAEKLGLDLTTVDILVLSHGHFDHGGGILAFAVINPKAAIYVQETAFGDFYADDGEEGYRYIGLDPAIKELPQLVLVSGNLEIDEELSLFSGIGTDCPVPDTNRRLKKKEGEEYREDDFCHEQCLAVRQDGQLLLFSGCAHHGILNVLKRCEEVCGQAPDAVFSGFHTMRKKGYTVEDAEFLRRMAREMAKYKTVFYTGHCTGEKPYFMLKRLLGRQIHYVHSGETVRLAAKKSRKAEYMKWHKFFAWATVACFILTMITGYQRK